MNKVLTIVGIILLTFSCQQAKKENTDNSQLKSEKKYQAKAPPTQTFGKKLLKNQTTQR